MSYNRYKVSIFVCDVAAKDEKQAKERALEQLDNLAGSNDGSEVLANAEPVVELLNENEFQEDPEYYVVGEESYG